MNKSFAWRFVGGSALSWALAVACGGASDGSPQNPGARVDADGGSTTGTDRDGGASSADGATVPPVPCVPTRKLTASADESAALMALLQAASTAAETYGPAGKQGRVYIGPGLHRFHDVVVPSNVRIEVDPGATLTAPEEAPTGDKNENPLFTLGATTEVHNITLIAGDGCGGPGTPTLANKLKNTGDRGNTEANGMSNMTVPHASRWPIDSFFVFDMDPKFRNVPSGTFGVRIAWATDVTVSKFFSIQNPERVTDANGNGTGPTVNFIRNPVIKPRANPASTFEAPQMPTRFHLSNVYNVLSPSGWGPVQVQACKDCTFEHIFSHGGVALRIETDNAAPICGHDACDGGCTKNGVTVPPVDDKGHGLAFYARVDGIEGDDIETALGNAGFTLTPHCQHNGFVHVKNVRGHSSNTIVGVQGGTSTTGFFDATSRIENVIGATDIPGKAQDANPQLDTYDLTNVQVALNWSPVVYTAKTAGTFCWPASLVDIRNPGTAQKPDPMPTFSHANCPAP